MKSFLIYIFLLIFPLTLGAQEVLKLEDAINIALKNNYDILIARNRDEVSKISNNLGMAGLWPTLNFNGTNNNSQTDLHQKLSTGVDIKKNDVVTHTYNAGLSAGLTLFNGLKVWATKERLNLLEAQSEVELNAEIQNIIADVMVNYYDILRQQSYLTIIQNSLDISKQESAIITERYNVGMANQADLLQAQMDVNRAEQNLISQQLIIEQEKVNLLEIMGVKDFVPITIKDTIIVDGSLQRDSILNSLENNPQYIAADQQIRINEQIIKEVRAQRYPSLRLTGGYNYSYNSSTAGFNLFNQNMGPAIGASLQIPVFNGTIYKTQQEVATYQVKTAELQREKVMLSLKAQALRTLQSYESRLEQIGSQQKNFEDAQKLVDIVVSRFQVNQTTILDLKNAQSSFENAGYLLVNLQFAAKIAEIELKRLAYLNNLDF